MAYVQNCHQCEGKKKIFSILQALAHLYIYTFLIYSYHPSVVMFILQELKKKVDFDYLEANNTLNTKPYYQLKIVELNQHRQIQIFPTHYKNFKFFLFSTKKNLFDKSSFMHYNITSHHKYYTIREFMIN